MPRAFGGTYSADKDPGLAALGQSTQNAAAKLKAAQDPAFLVELQLEAIRNFIQQLLDFTGLDLEAFAAEWISICVAVGSEGIELLRGFIGLGSGETIAAKLFSGIDQLFGWLSTDLFSNDIIDALIQPVYDFVKWLWAAFTNVNPGDLVDTILKPVIEFLKWLGQTFAGTLDTLLKPVFEFFLWLFGTVFNTTNLRTTVLQPIFEFLKWLGQTFSGTIETLLKPLFEFFNWLFGTLFNTENLRTTVLQPMFEFLKWLGQSFAGTIETLLKPIFEFFNWAFGTLFNTASLRTTVLQPVFEFLKWLGQTFAGTIDTVLKPIFEFFSGVSNTFGSVAEWTAQLGLSSILSVIGRLTGALNLANLGEGLAAIDKWITDIPTLKSLVIALTGGGQGTLVELVTWALNLLNGGSVLPAKNLLGSIPQELMSLIPAAHVGDVKPNLITDEAFASAAAVEAGNGWSWDGTTNVTGSVGGSAKLVCDGGVKQLFSNIVDVSVNQSLSFSAKFKWTKASNAVPTILVGVRTYYDPTGGRSAATVVGTFTAASIVATANAPAAGGFTLASGSSATLANGWVTVVGSYVIPAGVNRMRLVLGATSAPAGTTIWFDDATVIKTSLISQGLVANLTQELTAKLPTTDWQALLNTLASRIYGNTDAATLAQVQTVLNGFLNGSSTLNGGNIGAGNVSSLYIKELIDTWNLTYKSVTGYDPATGSIGNISQALNDFKTAVGQNASKLVEVQGENRKIVDAQSTVTGQIVALQGQVKELQIKVGSGTPTPPPPPVKITAFDDFERGSSASLGTNWTVSYQSQDGSKLATPDAHNASLMLPGISSTGDLGVAIFNGAVGRTSTGKTQWISATLGSGGGIPLAGTRGYCELIGLAASATTCVIVRFFADGFVKFGYRKQGWAFIPVADFKLPTNPTSGSTIEFYAGSSGSQTLLSARCGTSVLSPAYFPADLYGSLGTGWGFGMGSGLSGLAPQGSMSFNYWTAQDQ